MKTLILSLVFTLALASTSSAQIIPGEWLTDGIKANPVTGTVLAHYQDLLPNAETKVFHAMCASTANGVLFIEHIGADGNTVIRSQAFTVQSFVTFERMKQAVTLDINETIRIRTFGPTGTSGTITGSMQCSIYMDN